MDMVLAASGWSIGNLLRNATTTAQGWGGLFIVFLGVVAIIVAVVLAVKGLISHGKSQTNWLIVIALFIVGGACFAGGWGLVSTIASGGKDTIMELGTGSSSILPMLWTL